MAGNPRIDDLRKRLEKDPGSRLFAQLAEELRKDGDLEEAITVCREGLKRQPAYPSARMTLGRALYDTGDLAAARVEFETVLKGAADNILASRLLAECLDGLGDLQGAARQYRATLALAPGDKQIQAHLGDVEKRLKATPVPAPAAATPTVMIPPRPPPGRAPLPGPAPSFEPPPDTSPDRFPMPEPEPERRPEPQRDYAPIPLVAADETFELEAAHESTPTKVGGGSASAAGGDWVVGIAMPMPPPQAPAPSEPEPFPMPEEPPAVEEPPAAAGPEPVPAWAPPPRPAAEEPAEDFAEEFAPPEREAPRVGMPLELPPLAAEPAPPAAEEPAPPRVAEPAPVPAEAASPSSEPDLSSPTLAELYFNQGFTEKALAVYRQLLQREPGNERARARITEIEGLERHLRAEEARAPAAAPGAPGDARAARRQAIERTIARLEGLLAAVKREEP